MFKAIARASQKKQNYMITVGLAKIGADKVTEDIQLQVQWKRGPET